MLVLLGIVRAFALVAHDPVMGYANQYDMVRTSACLDLYPVGAEPFAGTAAAPIAWYRTLSLPTDLCYRGTEVALDSLVLHAQRSLGDGGDIALRSFGLAKLALLALAVLVVAGALHRHPAAALAHGAIVFFVLLDPVVMLWCNTLYTELPAIACLYAVIAGTCALALSPRWAGALWIVLALAIPGLAFSREQNALLAAALVAASMPWLWRRSRGLAAAILVLAFIASAASSTLPRPRVVVAANRADTYMGLLLPASSDPAAALRLLDLPARCASVIGADWYHRGDELRRTCPEVGRIPSTAFLRFVTAEPAVLARSLARVLSIVQPLAYPHLGTLEGAPFTDIEHLPWWARSPWKEAVDRVPLAIFMRLMGLAALLAPFAMGAALVASRRGHGAVAVAALAATLLAGTVVHAFLTTVFGDGLGGAARHFLLGSLALWSGGVGLLVAAGVAASRWEPRHSATWGARIAVAASVALAAIVVEGTIHWAYGQPLAIASFNTLDRIDRRGVVLEGWALDPLGIAAIDVEIGNVRRNADYGLPSEDVRRTYPSFPGSDRARFRLALDAAELARAGGGDPLALRMRIINRRGVVTEVERSNLPVGE